MSREEFEGASSGGGLSGFEFTVDKAVFAVDEKYSEKIGKPVWFMHWLGRSNVEGHELMDISGFHPKWATDPDFESLDGGVTIKSPSKGSKVGKAYGRACGAAAKATAHLANTPDDIFAGAATPTDSRIWVGTKWIMENVDTDFGGDIGKVTDLVPTQYLGKVDAQPVAAQPQLAAVPTAPAPQAAPAPAGNDLRSQVEALAASSPDYRTFQAAALQIPGVSSDSALLSDIANEGALWTRVRGQG